MIRWFIALALAATAFAVAALAAPALAGPARIVDASMEREGDTWRFTVTVRHDDEGWEHHVDQWEVIDRNGARIVLRPLLHPHVEEQPFTRSIGGAVIPDGETEVLIRAHDNVHGWSELFPLAVPR